MGMPVAVFTPSVYAMFLSQTLQRVCLFQVEVAQSQTASASKKIVAAMVAGFMTLACLVALKIDRGSGNLAKASELDEYYGFAIFA